LLAGHIASESKTYLRIELDNGASLEFHSAEQGDSLRGAGLDKLVIDEAALIEEPVWTHILRPMLTISKGGATFASTPAGRNWFYRAYLRGIDETEPQWTAFRSPTRDNPLVSSDDLDEARHAMTAAGFKQEYEAEFIADDSTAFPSVRDCVVPFDRLPEPSGRVCVGVDWGLVNDYTVLIALDPVAMRVLGYDRFRGLDINGTLARAADFCRAQSAELVFSDDTGLGKGLSAGLENAGLLVQRLTFSAQMKTRLMINLTLDIERRRLILPDDETFLSEIESCRRMLRRNGEFTVEAPSGLHDDIVDALALAVCAARSLDWNMPAGVERDFIEPPEDEGFFYL
jgi:hypothetical protein